ncbi:2OG-Fe dioxygenase family protein [Microbulbifer sp. EKSA008]|uniref:2OG-Fe dioxygenase family protein n=1 Tax=unclassified Microbulbifer TaxID=2619833 RepID=UPI00403A7128
MFQFTQILKYIPEELADSFAHLPPDEYLKSQNPYRYRTYSSGLYSGNSIEWSNNTIFIQSKTINTYLGDIERHYPSLGAIARIFSQNIVRHLISQQYIPAKKYQVGCHQIRVRATDEFNAYPTPEGFHQDGFDYVAINCINRNNVNGGESFISNLDENEIIFHGTLTPGKALVLNDRSLKHYVSPITPLFPGEALRDVVVITLHNDRNTT